MQNLKKYFLEKYLNLVNPEMKFYSLFFKGTNRVNSSLCFLKLSTPGFSGSAITLPLVCLFFFLLTLCAMTAAQFFGNNWKQQFQKYVKIHEK